MDSLLGVIALTNAIAAVLAWAAKLRWSAEYKDATNRMLEAKEETIKSLERQIKSVEQLNPKTMQEWYLGLKTLSEAYIEKLNLQLIYAKNKIDELESRGTDQNEELQQIKNAYARLGIDYQKLISEIDTKQIPDLRTLADSASSSQQLADSTSSESLAVKLLNTDDWEPMFKDLKIVLRK